MGLVVGLDFDGTLVEEGEPLRWRPRGRDLVLALISAGHTLVLHTGRSTALQGVGSRAGARQEADETWRTGKVPTDVESQWRRFADMRAFLQREGVWGAFAEVWQRAGKPHCDVYVDDRALLPDSLLEVWRSLGVDSL